MPYSVFQKGVEELVVGADYIRHIWVPDTFFVNEKVAYFHAATQVPQNRMRKIKIIIIIRTTSF